MIPQWIGDHILILHKLKGCLCTYCKTTACTLPPSCCTKSDQHVSCRLRHYSTAAQQNVSRSGMSKQKRWKLVKWSLGSSVVLSVGGALLYREMSPPVDFHFPPTVPVFEIEHSKYLSIDALKKHGLEVINQAHIDPKKGNWFPWLQSRSSNPWRLLKLAQSSDHTVRLLGVHTLAIKHDWTDHQCQQIAQACDIRTMIGLARSQGVDMRFFLQPPKEPASMEHDMEDHYRALLSSLPKSKVNRCVQYITSMALHEGNVTEERGGLYCFGGTGLEFAKSLSRVPEEKVEIFCLEALSSHSTIRSHCDEMIRLGALQLLAVVQNTNSYVVRRLAAKIVGNLAVHPHLHKQIVQSGWVSILAYWINSPDLSLSFHASRALANLDRDYGPRVYEDSIYLIHPAFRTSDAIYADVIFIHGILGGAFKTWRQEDKARQEELTDASGQRIYEPYTFCWPKTWLAEDCPHLRILSVDYDTHLSDWAAKCPFESEKRSLTIRSAAIMEKLIKAGVGQRPIIWIGHSMGGLIIKELICQAEAGEHTRNIAHNTHGVIFYGVPHRGSSLASASKQAGILVNPSIEVRELSKDSLKLRVLHEKFTEFMQHHTLPCLSFGELEKTSLGVKMKMIIVPPESSDPGYGEFHPIESDHLNICKPRDRNSYLYETTLKFIRKYVPQNLVENIIKASLKEDGFGIQQSGS